MRDDNSGMHTTDEVRKLSWMYVSHLTEAIPVSQVGYDQVSYGLPGSSQIVGQQIRYTGTKGLVIRYT